MIKKMDAMSHIDTVKNESGNKADARIGVFVSFILALAPVFDPYVVVIKYGEIRIVNIVMIALVVYLLISKKCNWTRRGLSLVILAAVFFLCTLFSAIDYVAGRSAVVAIRVAAMYLIYSFCYSAISGYRLLFLFSKIATVIALLATVLLLLQFAACGNFWDGSLPLPLSKTDEFMPLIDPTTGQVRPHGFFQEVSYYSFYTAPVLMYAAFSKNRLVSLVLSIGLLLSNSFIGYIILVFFVFMICLHIVKHSRRVNRENVVLVITGIMFIFLLAFVLLSTHAIPALNSLFDEIGRRVASVLDIFSTYSWGRSSAQKRLLGNINLFGLYGPVQQMFGMGVGEYINVFSGVETTYGSSVVNMLLGFGILGEVALFLWMIRLVFRSPKDTKVFAMLVVLALFSDNVLFGWYFFYLFSWCADTRESDFNKNEIKHLVEHWLRSITWH